MTSHDLGPATARLATLVAGVPDDLLDAPTPCEGTSVGDLLDHIDNLARAFTAAARKATGELTGQPPPPDASHLGDDWRTRIPRALADLADAWRQPEAWHGTTAAGGLEMPGEVAGLVALDEVVIHGWDLAKATRQPYDCDLRTLEATHGFVRQFAEPGQEAAREGLFGPVVEVPDSAPLLDRVIGLTGRDPAWSPARDRSGDHAPG
jgi:uncharacterized protein (TIGR03086 family)